LCLLCLAWSLFAACGVYGEVGGADITDTYREPADIARYIDGWQGGLYSRYAQRLQDGYIIGKWNALAGISDKLGVFPDFEITAPQFLNSGGTAVAAVTPDASIPRGSPGSIHPDDYYILYDDTVYGQNSSSGRPGSRGYSYLAVVRGINLFDRNPGHGALIVEYLAGCYPERYPFGPAGGVEAVLPFFGIFFRAVSRTAMQMTNPYKRAERLNGRPYYTETATLEEAFALNNVENDVEFVDWGDETPRELEGCRE
jgi:hypothetical protein